MANINIPRSEARVNYINRILADSDDKAIRVLHSVTIPPYIPYSHLVTTIDLASSLKVSVGALKSALHCMRTQCDEVNIFRKVSLLDLKLDPEDECVCRNDNICHSTGYRAFRNHAIDGECNIAHIPSGGRKFFAFTPKAILAIAMFVGKKSSVTEKIRNAITKEYSCEDFEPEMKLTLPAPVPAVLPPAPEASMIVPAEVPNIEPKHALLETPIPEQVQPVKISLEVSDNETIVITPQVFQFMVRQCANIIRRGF